MKEPLSVRASDTVFHFVVGTFYAYALCLSVMASTILEPPGRRMLLFCAGGVLLFSLLFSHRYITLSSLGIVVVFCLWVAYHLWKGSLDKTWLGPLISLVEEFSWFAQGAVPYRAAFNDAAELWLAVAFSLVTVLNTQLHFGFYLLCLVAVAVLGVPTFMPDWGRSEEAAILMVFCFLAMLARKLYQNAGRESASPTRYVMLLLPLAALVFGASWKAPKPDVETMNGWAESAQQFMTEMPSLSPAPRQEVVFSENNESLGGPAGLNDTVVMEVEAGEPLYLSGSIRDTYTGRGWTASNRETEQLEPEEGVYQTVDQPDALRMAQEYYQRFYAFPNREVTITMKTRTRMLFSPPSRSSTSVTEPISLSRDAYGGLSAKQPVKAETSYTHTYIGWDRENPYYHNLLQIFAGESGIQGLSEEELAPYLTLPEDLPDRVKKLAWEQTAGCRYDYDRLQSLEGFLAQTYPYTLEPGPVPAGEDFVDYFLFEGKRGYCVYYASAMAVLARVVGIPTRYVEGYITPKENVGGVYTVTNRQAHAWVEAYIAGFGWVIFEPTAAYYPGMEEIIAAEEPEPEPDPEPEPEPELESEPDPQPEPPPAVDPEAEEPASEEPERSRAWLLLLLIPLLGLGGYAGVRWLIRRHEAHQQALGALPNREAVIALFGAILAVADTLEIPIRRGETPLAYAGRVGDMLSFRDHPGGMTELAGIFSRAAYSRNEVSVYERSLVEGCYFELMAQLRDSRKNRLRYTIDRYLLQKY